MEKLVDFCGPGLDSLSLPDRATVANMCPEYGATVGFFPVDEKTLDYLRLSGRDETLIARVESYSKEQGLFRSASQPDLVFSDSLALDLGTVEPCLAGPKRPQDRVTLKQVKRSFEQELQKEKPDGGKSKRSGKEVEDGSVVIAAITSCTNTYITTCKYPKQTTS